MYKDQLILQKLDHLNLLVNVLTIEIDKEHTVHVDIIDEAINTLLDIKRAR